MPQTDQYPISDFLKWIDEKTVILNTDFQRRSIWPPAAKVFLIDTILRDRPMPNIYVRHKTNLVTRRAYREVVDGQQRLRAIHEFGTDRLTLTNKAKEFAGKRYSDLDDEFKTKFLDYGIGTVQLFNIPDVEVLDIFQRINAYGLRLNNQEVRHGKFQGEFRDAVINSAKLWEPLWQTYSIVGLRDRVRMADDQLMAEMLGVVLEGVTDGGQPRINGLYKRYDEDLPKDAVKKLDKAIRFCLNEMSPILHTGLSRGPHFLMLFAAVSHALFEIPEGDVGEDMPDRHPEVLKDLGSSLANLGLLADTLQSDDIDDTAPHLAAFKSASSTSTQRIRGRKVRFLTLYRALLPKGF